MKKLIAELILGISFFSTSSNAAAETIKMLYGNLPPYMYLDEQTQTPRGASITYFEAVATEMGYNVEWVGPFPQARFLQNIKSPDNEVAGAITIVKYVQTEAFLEFPDTPYLQTWPSIAVHHDDPLQKINTMQDLDSYSIGGMAGDVLPEPFDQLKIEPIFEEKWVEQNLKKLIARRVDAVFSREAYMLAFHASKLKLDEKNQNSFAARSTNTFLCSIQKRRTAE